MKQELGIDLPPGSIRHFPQWISETVHICSVFDVYRSGSIGPTLPFGENRFQRPENPTNLKSGNRIVERLVFSNDYAVWKFVRVLGLEIDFQLEITRSDDR